MATSVAPHLAPKNQDLGLPHGTDQSPKTFITAILSDNLDCDVTGAGGLISLTLRRGVVDFPHARFLRIKMALGGANPTAWIQVKATVKPYGGA